MNDNQTVKVKQKTYSKKKIDDKIACDVKITKEAEIKFKKDAKRGESKAENGDIEVKIQKYKENNDRDGDEVEGKIKASDIIYDGGSFEQGVKFSKITLNSGGEITLKEELSPGVKGYKTLGWLSWIGGGLLLLAVIGGLIYWMTRSSGEE